MCEWLSKCHKDKFQWHIGILGIHSSHVRSVNCNSLSHTIHFRRKKIIFMRDFSFEMRRGRNNRKRLLHKAHVIVGCGAVDGILMLIFDNWDIKAKNWEINIKKLKKSNCFATIFLHLKIYRIRTLNSNSLKLNFKMTFNNLQSQYNKQFMLQSMDEIYLLWLLERILKLNA